MDLVWNDDPFAAGLLLLWFRCAVGDDIDWALLIVVDDDDDDDGGGGCCCDCGCGWPWFGPLFNVLVEIAADVFDCPVIDGCTIDDEGAILFVLLLLFEWNDGTNGDWNRA